jgi:hypothetical protein
VKPEELKWKHSSIELNLNEELQLGFELWLCLCYEGKGVEEI